MGYLKLAGATCKAQVSKITHIDNGLCALRKITLGYLYFLENYSKYAPVWNRLSSEDVHISIPTVVEYLQEKRRGRRRENVTKGFFHSSCGIL